MTVSAVNGSLLSGNEAVQSAQYKGEQSGFDDLVKSMQIEQSKNSGTVASEKTIDSSRLNGDYTTGFSSAHTAADKNATATGAAANQSGAHGESRKIDKTSKLYEKALEMESYVVKIMLSSMRSTVQKSGLGGDDFASKMYEDMLYDEYATSMTKNAGFGLADEIYLQLNQQA